MDRNICPPPNWSSTLMPDGQQPLVSQASPPPPIILQQMPPPPFWTHRWFVRFLIVALALSLAYSVRLNSEYHDYFNSGHAPAEHYHSGDKDASDKIAVIEVSGTIMPPFTR